MKSLFKLLLVISVIGVIHVSGIKPNGYPQKSTMQPGMNQNLINEVVVTDEVGVLVVDSVSENGVYYAQKFTNL
jgi:hypothetical protein